MSEADQQSKFAFPSASKKRSYRSRRIVWTHFTSRRNLKSDSSNIHSKTLLTQQRKEIEERLFNFEIPIEIFVYRCAGLHYSVLGYIPTSDARVRVYYHPGLTPTRSRAKSDLELIYLWFWSPRMVRDFVGLWGICTWRQMSSSFSRKIKLILMNTADGNVTFYDPARAKRTPG